ncbi:MAG: polyprenol monophosphomannose synthase [Pirellulaceae bacterium]
MPPSLRLLVAIATYNEIENLPALVDEVFEQAPQADILVVDDNSPDGTGHWCDERAAKDRRLRVLHRSGKLGLGTATLEAMRYAVEYDYDLLLTMDADFSHHPRYLPNLVQGLQAEGDDAVDVMIGSRYVPGGGVQGWPLRRRIMSRMVNFYARWMLGLSPKDCSGAYRCFRVKRIEEIDFTSVRSRGYSFFEEILWHLSRKNARFGETPILFVDRQQGQSKINLKEAYSALWIIFRLGLTNWFGRR